MTEGEALDRRALPMLRALCDSLGAAGVATNGREDPRFFPAVAHLLSVADSNDPLRHAIASAVLSVAGPP